MIHICYAVTDKKGTYTKYVGASMCSVFEHTQEWVTVHFMHDYTLSTDNRRYLMQLVREYGQQIVFYDFEKLYGKRLSQLEEKNKWMDKMLKQPLKQAMWYRLLAGEVFKGLERIIYLDGDTIVNLDIRELWEEEIGGNGLAAVSDIIIQENHYSMMVKKGLYDEEKYFNSGVLLIEPKVFGKEENLIERGCEFLKENQLVDYPDQDILNYFYGEKCRLLPEKYNTLVSHEFALRHENVGECIYHYAGQTYALDAVNNFHRLFLEFLTKTPWCNADFLGNMARNIHQANRSLMLSYANFIAGMRRIVVAHAEEKEKLQRMLALKEHEEFLTPRELNARGMRLETNEILLFFVKPDEFEKIKKHLESCGCSEGVHFVNGNIFLYRDVAQDARIIRDS